MKCEKCQLNTGFNYRGNVLCATCIDEMIYKCRSCSARIGFNEQGRGFCNSCYEINKASEIKKPPLQTTSIDCEICGKSSVTSIGISNLCKSCAYEVELCPHSNCEVIEELIDNYLHTICLCQDCGLRFTNGLDCE